MLSNLFIIDVCDLGERSELDMFANNTKRLVA